MYILKLIDMFWYRCPTIQVSQNDHCKADVVLFKC